MIDEAKAESHEILDNEKHTKEDLDTLANMLSEWISYMVIKISGDRQTIDQKRELGIEINGKEGDAEQERTVVTHRKRRRGRKRT